MTMRGAGLAKDLSYGPGMDRRPFLLTSLAGVVAATRGAEAQPADRDMLVRHVEAMQDPQRITGALRPRPQVIALAEGGVSR